MTRVATVPLQRTMSGAIQRAQQQLATSQMQLHTGKKAQDYAGLGTQTVRVLSARSMLSQQEAYASVADRVENTLEFQDAHLTDLDKNMVELRDELLNTVGTGDGPGLQKAIENAFADFRNTLNASEAGLPIFGGSQTATPPFKPLTLTDTIGLNPADAFANDQVRASARLGDGIDVEYGVVASDIGEKMVQAFRTLAEAGPIADKPTAAQMTALKQAIGEIDGALVDVRAVNGNNGRVQGQVETLAKRTEERSILLEEVIGKAEDADLGQVAIDISQRKAMLEASYSAFAQLSGLSLVNFLR